MDITIQPGDITKSTQTPSNAANSTLLGGGVDGAIHRAGPQILAETKKLRETVLPDGLPAGQAVATTAGNLRWSSTVNRYIPPKIVQHPRLGLRESPGLQTARGANRGVSSDLRGVYGWPLDVRSIAVETVVESILISPLFSSHYPTPCPSKRTCTAHLRRRVIFVALRRSGGGTCAHGLKCKCQSPKKGSHGY